MISNLAPENLFLVLFGEFALKGTVFLVLTWVAARAFRKAGAALRHLLWLMALAGLLALPVVTAMLPGWKALPAWSQKPKAEARAIAAPGSQALAVSPSEIRQQAVPLIAPEDLKPGRLIGQSVAQVIREGIIIVWALGFCALCIRLMAGSWMLHRLERNCIAVKTGRISELTEMVCQRLGVRQRIQVRLDSERTIPVVYGILRPCLLLPADAIDWDEARLRCVLLHEIAHIKRADVAAQLMTQLACALHWFNPLVWLAARRLLAEAERACDDLVLAAGVRGSDYAEQLLHFAGKACMAGWLQSSGLAMAQRSQLEGRLAAVLDQGQDRTGRTRLAALVALLIALCFLIPLAILRAAEEQPLGQPVEPTSADEAKPKTPISAEAAAAAEYNAEMKQLARVRVEQAEKELKRAEELYQQKVISQAEYEKAKYAVERQRAEMVRWSNLGMDGSAAPVQSARADVDVAAAELALTRATLKRVSLLAEQKAISQVEREHAEAEVAFAEAKLRLAKSRLEHMSAAQSAPQKLPGTGIEEKTAEDTEVLKAELNLAKVTLDTSRVRLERVAKLAEQGVVPREMLEEAQMDVDRAEGQLKLQKARLGNARRAGQ